MFQIEIFVCIKTTKMGAGFSGPQTWFENEQHDHQFLKEMMFGSGVHLHSQRQKTYADGLTLRPDFMITSPNGARRVIVDSKFYENSSIGRDQVQKLLRDVSHAKASQGVLLCSPGSTLTSGAQKLADEKGVLVVNKGDPFWQQNLKSQLHQTLGTEVNQLPNWVDSSQVLHLSQMFGIHVMPMPMYHQPCSGEIIGTPLLPPDRKSVV